MPTQIQTDATNAYNWADAALGYAEAENQSACQSDLTSCNTSLSAVSTDLTAYTGESWHSSVASKLADCQSEASTAGDALGASTVIWSAVVSALTSLRSLIQQLRDLLNQDLEGGGGS